MYQSIARSIARYYEANRGVGHTHAILQGADGCIVLVATVNHGKELHKLRPDADFITSGILTDKLHSSHKPLILDNFYLTNLLKGMLDEAELDKQGAVNDAYRNVIKILQNSRDTKQAINLLEDTLKQRKRSTHATKNNSISGTDSSGDSNSPKRNDILPF